MHLAQASQTSLSINTGRVMAARELRRGDMVYDAIGARQGQAWQVVRSVAIHNDGSVHASFVASEKRMTGSICLRVVRAH